MAGNARMAAVGICLLLLSGAAFTRVGIGGGIPTALLGIASLGAVGLVVQLGNDQQRTQ